jgi:hypothetical protein
MTKSEQWFKRKFGIYLPIHWKGWVSLGVYFWMVQEWIWYFSLPKYSAYAHIVVPAGVIVTTLTFLIFCKSRS